MKERERERENERKSERGGEIKRTRERWYHAGEIQSNERI